MEVIVVIGMVGALMGMTVWGIRGWSTAKAHKGAGQQVQAVMRTTHQRAITEGKSFCVEFDTATDKFAVFRYACTDPARVKTSGWFGTGSHLLHLTGPAFVDASDTPRTGVTFSPRGSAWPGQVAVVRDGSSVSYTVRVEGMTGRVSVD